ncbi:MAG TPA: DMT family transporter [Acidimicrobiales bacterium]|nr:DMT family transporter [Acidimicrobiales bacterium]
MAYVLALLAALAFALGNVLQQKGTLEAPADENDPRFLAQILRRPVWLAGAGCQLAGWVLQAVALDRGSLIVVQSLTTMSLVIALPLGRRITDQQVDTRVWLGAAAMVVGIVLFLAAGSPQGGTSSPAASAWWSAGLSSLVLVLLLGNLGRHRHGAAKALLLGSAAGVGFALQASVTKLFVTLVGKGLATIMTSWTIYVLILSALAGFVLQQSALKTGVLAPAMASSNSVTLFASVVFGITIFGEKLSAGGAGHLAPAVIGLAVALTGIVLLAGAKPPQRAEPVPSLEDMPRSEPHPARRHRRAAH